MELILNLVWVALALAGLVCWLGAERSQASSTRTQLVALAMLLLILFPVISVTDDFWAAQNPAEADSCMRRNELTAHPHAIVPEIPIPVPTQAMEVSLAVVGYRAAGEPPSPKHQDRPQSALFIRPPPAA